LDPSTGWRGAASAPYLLGCVATLWPVDFNLDNLHNNNKSAASQHNPPVQHKQSSSNSGQTAEHWLTGVACAWLKHTHAQLALLKLLLLHRSRQVLLTLPVHAGRELITLLTHLSLNDLRLLLYPHANGFSEGLHNTSCGQQKLTRFP
jgi:hypothetical protein